MTLEEKITLITGQPGRCVGMTGAVERLGVPALCLEDGPAGVRPVQGISQFPGGQAVAATWDRDLIYARGYAMGKEFFDQYVQDVQRLTHISSIGCEGVLTLPWAL